MRKTEKIYLGDKVKTKATFKPILQNEERFNPNGTVYEGEVVGKRGNYLLIDFHEKLPFTHYLGGILNEPTGHAVEHKHLIITDTYKSDDSDEMEFVGLIKELKFEEIKKVPMEIRDKEDSINNLEGNIRSKLRTIESEERKLEKEEYDLKLLKEKKVSTSIDIDKISKQYKAMKKNSKIKNIKVIDDGESCVLLTTNDLIYSNDKTKIKDYNLGAFKILIPMNVNRNITAINYKKHVQKFIYHHPCIKRSEMCLGQAMIDEVFKLRNTNNIINLSHLLINFLERPNYNTPHIGEREFMCSQDVTISPRNELDWFNSNYWDKELWDGDKYSKDLRELNSELNNLEDCPNCSYGGRNSNNNCSSCGHEFST